MLYPEDVFDKCFGESVVYNGVDITGVVTIGQTGQSGNGYGSLGTSDFAKLTVKKSDVPSPSVRDTITFRKIDWKYVRIEQDDGIMVTMQVRRNTRHA